METQGWMFVRRIAVAGIVLLLAAAVVCAQDASKSERKDPDPIVKLFSAKSSVAPRQFSIVEAARIDRPRPRTEASRPTTTINPVDIRNQARNYVKQRILSEILSRTALGRGLSVFVDTGKTGIDPTRSRLLPFISPKVSARDGGRAAITFTWKF